MEVKQFLLQERIVGLLEKILENMPCKHEWKEVYRDISNTWEQECLKCKLVIK